MKAKLRAAIDTQVIWSVLCVGYLHLRQLEAAEDLARAWFLVGGGGDDQTLPGFIPDLLVGRLRNLLPKQIGFGRRAGVA